jgi:hypothetical protein
MLALRIHGESWGAIVCPSVRLALCVCVPCLVCMYVCGCSHLCVLECLCDLPLPDVVQEGQAVQLEPRQHRGEEEAEALSGFEGEQEACLSE